MIQGPVISQDIQQPLLLLSFCPSWGSPKIPAGGEAQDIMPPGEETEQSQVLQKEGSMLGSMYLPLYVSNLRVT